METGSGKRDDYPSGPAGHLPALHADGATQGEAGGKAAATSQRQGRRGEREHSKLHIKNCRRSGKTASPTFILLDIAMKIALRQSAEKVIMLDRVLFDKLKA